MYHCNEELSLAAPCSELSDKAMLKLNLGLSMRKSSNSEAATISESDPLQQQISSCIRNSFNCCPWDKTYLIGLCTMHMFKQDLHWFNIDDRFSCFKNIIFCHVAVDASKLKNPVTMTGLTFGQAFFVGNLKIDDWKYSWMSKQ